MNSSRYPCNWALLASSRSNVSAWPYFIPALVAYSAYSQQQSEPGGPSAGAAAAAIEDHIGIWLAIAAKHSRDPTTFAEMGQSAVAAKPSRDPTNPTTFAKMGFVELINITYKSDTGSHLSRFETDSDI